MPPLRLFARAARETDAPGGSGFTQIWQQRHARAPSLAAQIAFFPACAKAGISGPVCATASIVAALCTLPGSKVPMSNW